jgi:hypothetical protein
MHEKTFSQRIGKTPIKTEIQIDKIDAAFRNSLWNILHMYICKPIDKQSFLSRTDYEKFIESIWFYHFKEPMDNIASGTGTVISELRTRFFKWNYLEVYDFFDFIVRAKKTLPFSIDQFIQDTNSVLKRQLSGYRFVNGILSPITDEIQIKGIENAIEKSDDNGFQGVNILLTKALEKLSDKDNPDYRNSIKESISAVESICQQITKDNNAELGKALKN